MKEIPNVEPQNSISVLRDLKSAVAAAKKRLDSNTAVLRHARDLLKQNQFYERGIDGARGRIFMLMVAQLRHAEAAHSEEYVSQIDESLEQLVDQEKEEGKK